jgi:hypothetical protein
VSVRRRIVGELARRLLPVAAAALGILTLTGGASTSAAPATPPARLVFSAEMAHGPTAQVQLYSIEPAGRGAAQLTFAVEPSSAPLPSPDGRWIVFARAGAIWVMRPDGGGQRRLVAHGTEPAWAPDSRGIAYVRFIEGRRFGIRAIRVDGTGDRSLVSGEPDNPPSSPTRTGGVVDSPAWSPDGRSLAFARDGSVVILSGGLQRTLVAGPDAERAEGIRWSYDGRWLAFDDQDPVTELPVVRVVSVSGARRRTLPLRPFAWSSRAALLAYATGGAGTPASVNILNVATGRVRKLVARAPYVNSLAWSPAGDAIAFSTAMALSEGPIISELAVVTLKGHVRELDDGRRFPLPSLTAWTTTPTGARFHPAERPGPIVVGDELRFREPIAELATDGDRVAYRTCLSIGVWYPGNDPVVPVRPELPLCSTGNVALYGIALAGDTAAWGDLRGGNVKSNTLVAAPLVAGAPQTILAGGGHHTSGDPRSEARAGFLLGAGSLLTFSTWRYCDDALPACQVPYGQGGVVSQTLWRARDPSWPTVCPGADYGLEVGRCQALRTEPGPLRPLDTDGTRIVASGDNATLVLDADGRELLSLPVSTPAAQLDGSNLVLLLPGELRVYDTASGALLHTWPLPDVSSGADCRLPGCNAPRLRLEDAARGLVAYILDGTLHLLRLADGADAIVHDGTAAQFGDTGLFYAYDARLPWRGRIRFVRYDRLPLR